MRSRAAHSALVALLVVTACSSGATNESGSSVATTGTDATDVAGTSVERTTTTAPDSELDLRLTEVSIWAATEDAEVCSPIEPSASDLEVRSRSEFELLVALWESSDGHPNRRLLEGSVDDGWLATIGPVRARRGVTDTVVELTVVGFSADAAAELAEFADLAELADGEPATAAEWAEALELIDDEELLERADDSVDAELEVLAPVRCAEGERRDRSGRSKSNPSLGVEAEFPEGLEVWAAADGFCGAGPTVLGVSARTSGEPARVEVRWVGASGASGSQRMLSTGANRWRGEIGPLKASGSMPAQSDLSVQVVASDAAGNEASVSSLVTVRRPTPCDAAGSSTTVVTATTPPSSTGPSTTTPVTAPTAVTVEARTNTSEVWASGGNTCPAGPTSVTVEARTTGAVTAVQVRATTANGTELGNKSMNPAGANTWSASFSSIAASGNMPESSQLTITVRATAGGATVTDTVAITLRKPALCATTTSPPSPPTTAPPTTAPPTTQP